MAWLKPVFPVSATAIIVLGLYTWGMPTSPPCITPVTPGRRSFNIGVNECLVGMGSFAGLFEVQWGEMLLGKDGGMYAVCAVALLVSLLIQVSVQSGLFKAPEFRLASAKTTRTKS